MKFYKKTIENMCYNILKLPIYLKKGFQLHLKDEKARNFDVRVYKNVTIGAPIPSNRGIVWKLEFETKKYEIKLVKNFLF